MVNYIASAISKIENGQLKDIIVKNGGSGYRINFTPKTTILTPADTIGENATAEALVNGIKDITLIDGGQGYTAANPPIIIFDEPADPSGIPAKATVTVDDASGQVTAINVQSSGSGYDSIPSISFVNPGGAKISDSQIDADGSIVPGSITVVEGGLNYANPPVVYIDPPTEDAVNPISASAVTTLDDQGLLTALQSFLAVGDTLLRLDAELLTPLVHKILDVSVTGGKLTDIELLTGGSGYTDAPSVYIVDNRKDLSGNPIGGTGATSVATIFNGEITDKSILPVLVMDIPKLNLLQSLLRNHIYMQRVVTLVLVKLLDLLLHSHGENYKPSQFKNCKRGVSGVA